MDCKQQVLRNRNENTDNPAGMEDTEVDKIVKGISSSLHQVINATYIPLINKTEPSVLTCRNLKHATRTCKDCDGSVCTRCNGEDKIVERCQSIERELRYIKCMLFVLSALVVMALIPLYIVSSYIDREELIMLGMARTNLPRTCLDLRGKGFYKSGVYAVYPTGRAHYTFDVYCDQDTDGGGWTVFQRRMNGEVDFYRNWRDYKLGFGDVKSEHWLGNDKLAQLLAIYSANELRVDLETADNEKAYALYSIFSVGDESSNYTLYVSNYTGTAGDSLSYGNGQQFSTHDQDNDPSATNCARRFKGAWWYMDCHMSNLNGQYLSGKHYSYANGVNWWSFKEMHESMETTEMKFRAHR